MKKLAFFFVTLIATAFSNTVYADKDVELSWERAQVYGLDNLQINVSQTKPVVIYLHGCSGIKSHDHNWASELNNLGFVVVMPDSFARPGRISNCDPVAKKGIDAFPKAHDYRQQEISYALEQVLKSNWADKNNIFLMGHSEGGIAVAITNQKHIAGGIISGWTCTSPNPVRNGINLSKEIPILSIASVDDEWRKGTNNEGSCATFAQDRNYFKSVNLPGWHHNTYGYSEARQAVQKFLITHKKTI